MHKPGIATQALAAITMAAPFALPISAKAVQYPGPSPQFYSDPYYQCHSYYYVSASGQNSGNGSQSNPWPSLQDANNFANRSGKLSAGACVEVSPGTYNGVWLTQSGSTASASGYIVYRCTKMDACTINGTAGPNGNAGFYSATDTGTKYPPANYTIIDGFTITGNGSVYGVGVEFAGSSNGKPDIFGSHHDWVLNSVISHFGQGGIGFSEGDYTYAVHNLIYGNAWAESCDNGAQGSGLGDVIALDITYAYPKYAPTPDDKVNPNPFIGSFMNGSHWFHKAYEWNIVANNFLSPCGTGDTDGNNIIIDTFGIGNGNPGPAYPDQTLIAFNKIFNAGGGGIHVFYSEYVTVANNSVYNNHLDPYEQSGGAAIDSINSYGNTFINNIAVGIPAYNDNGQDCAFFTTPYAKFNNAINGSLLVANKSEPNPPPDTFSHNITQLQGGNYSCWGQHGQMPPSGEIGLWNGDTYPTNMVKGVPANKVNTNPKWVAVGNVTTGNEYTSPWGRNFALQGDSPAIGYGLKEEYLPAESEDVGACAHTLRTC